MRGSAVAARHNGTMSPDAIQGLAAELRSLERLTGVFDALAESTAAAYLVGGTVRDILLGRPGFDVDVAVEGDAIAVAERVAAALGGTVRTHGRFGTAVVRHGAGERLDLVTARTESYAAPGALPTVAAGSIEDDLARRDFTVNAMAVSLARVDFGRLVDPFSGRSDLEAKRIRVLHERSFVDDPTRIFRAIRYENRLGFRMDETTLGLARASVDGGGIGRLSGARVREELVALLDEADVGHSLERVAELGVGRALHPQLAADAETAALVRRLSALRDELAPEIPRWRLALAALTRRIPPEEGARWLESLKLRRRDVEQISAAIVRGPELAAQLSSGDPSPAEIVAAADRGAPDAPLFALGLAESEPLRKYFRRLRGVRLEVTGSDLAELGLDESPRVGEVLAELRRKKLNGDVDGRESELAAARELLGS